MRPGLPSSVARSTRSIQILPPFAATSNDCRARNGVEDQSRIEFNRQRADELRELIERAQGEISAAESRKVQHSAQMQETDSLIEKTNADLQARESELKELTQELERVRSERGLLEKKGKELQIAAAKSESRAATLAEELSGTIARRDATVGQINALTITLKDAGTAREKIVNEIQSASSTVTAEQKRLADFVADSQTAENDLQRGKRRVVRNPKKPGRIRKDVGRKKIEARYSAVS